MLNLSLAVLRALLTKRGWWGLSHLVSVDTFKTAEYRQLFKLLSRLHEHTEGDIIPDTLAAAIEATYMNSEEQCGQLIAMVQLLEETPELPEDQLSQVVRQFLQRSTSYAIAEYVTSNVEQADFDANVVAALAARSVEVSDRIGAPVLDIFDQGLPGATHDQPVRLSLGVSRKLDACLRGGIGPGELGVYLAPPATGKTSFLVASGAAHARSGGTVFHVTLEINFRKALARYYQAWTGKVQSEIETAEGQAAAAHAQRVVKAAGGRVLIADWAYMTVTANDIGAEIRRQRASGVDISLVVIDYLGLMSEAQKSGKEMRQKFSTVGKEMRQLARNLNLPVLTAWQVNREGSKSDTLEATDIAESWDIVMIADSIIGLNQNAGMREHKRLKVNVIKQRESTARHAYDLYCDLDRMVIRDVQAEDHFNEVREIGREAPAAVVASARELATPNAGAVAAGEGGAVHSPVEGTAG